VVEDGSFTTSVLIRLISMLLLELREVHAVVQREQPRLHSARDEALDGLHSDWQNRGGRSLGIDGRRGHCDAGHA
jgi:hypothetical protein